MAFQRSPVVLHFWFPRRLSCKSFTRPPEHDVRAAKTHHRHQETTYRDDTSVPGIITKHPLTVKMFPLAEDEVYSANEGAMRANTQAEDRHESTRDAAILNEHHYLTYPAHQVEKHVEPPTPTVHRNVPFPDPR
eukprot:gnl/MRDRNA2_/MRDRNA2_292264_c0_seq1.p2 gnl/MRDRNA2_/MRDRNA2_292264_c0~~gnl/MRDRNA2_/MRDRNA2_292264_c0_seq1.p2  ORF type:complete len:134 (-),score=10.81 gnl/MRDRNA2_/MRDRNA2_292264_c0_seq1:53-454(-)